LVQSRRRDADVLNSITTCGPIAAPRRVLDSVWSRSNHDVRVGQPVSPDRLSLPVLVALVEMALTRHLTFQRLADVVKVLANGGDRGSAARTVSFTSGGVLRMVGQAFVGLRDQKHFTLGCG
jgi:hypothetical protein